MDKVCWIRWYKLYADGMTPSTDEQYNYQWYNVDNATKNELCVAIEADLEEGINLYEEGEHYRCFRWEFIDRPPLSYIQAQLRYHTRSMQFHQEMVNMYNGLIEVGMNNVREHFKEQIEAGSEILARDGKLSVYFVLQNKSGTNSEVLKVLESDIETYFGEGFEYLGHYCTIPKFRSLLDSIKVEVLDELVRGGDE